QEGTTCSHCYAQKGSFRFQNVQKKLEERYQGLTHPLWVPAMVYLILRHATDGYFRWFDTGDLQSASHLHNIIQVAKATPEVRHWLPTREYAIVRACAGELAEVENLAVRVSATKVNGDPPAWWPQTSRTVEAQEPGPGVCPSPEQDNNCRLC